MERLSQKLSNQEFDRTKRRIKAAETVGRTPQAGLEGTGMNMLGDLLVRAGVMTDKSHIFKVKFEELDLRGYEVSTQVVVYYGPTVMSREQETLVKFDLGEPEDAVLINEKLFNNRVVETIDTENGIEIAYIPVVYDSNYGPRLSKVLRVIRSLYQEEDLAA
jgi:hypothetical protein